MGKPALQRCDADEALRVQVRAALEAAGISQAAAARELGLSTKHMSHLMTGRAVLTLAWAERILVLCNRRLVVSTRRVTRAGRR